MPMKLLIALGLLMAHTIASASVVIQTSRVIYNEGAGEALVRLYNDNPAPRLVQVWLDQGDADARPETIDAPFILTPAVARVDEAHTQVVRLLRTREIAARDRETLFWFNALEIPPRPTQTGPDGANQLQLAFRSRLKFFYRPAALTQSPEAVLDRLVFTIDERTDGDRRLKIDNPTPYHITFHAAALRHDEHGEALARVSMREDRMVAPFSQLSVPFEIDAGQALPPGLGVFFSIFNDQGGITVARSSIERGVG